MSWQRSRFSQGGGLPRPPEREPGEGATTITRRHHIQERDGKDATWPTNGADVCNATEVSGGPQEGDWGRGFLRGRGSVSWNTTLITRCVYLSILCHILSYTLPYWVIWVMSHIDIFICSVMQVKLTRPNSLLVRWVCSPYWATPPPPWKSLVSSAKRRQRILPHRSGHSSRLSMYNNHVYWESARLAIQAQVCIVYMCMLYISKMGII